jgi:hypothetical protein
LCKQINDCHLILNKVKVEVRLIVIKVKLMLINILK